MPIIWTNQRRTLHAEDTSDDRALSARMYKRAAHNVNNLAFTALKMGPMQHWPGGYDVKHGLTTFQYEAEWPELIWPGTYRDIRFVIGGYVKGAGQAINVRLGVMRHLYQGVDDRMPVWYADVQINTVAHMFAWGRITGIPSFEDDPHMRYVLWTQAVAPGDGAYLYTLKAWAKLSGL